MSLVSTVKKAAWRASVRSSRSALDNVSVVIASTEVVISEPTGLKLDQRVRGVPQ